MQAASHLQDHQQPGPDTPFALALNRSLSYDLPAPRRPDDDTSHHHALAFITQGLKQTGICSPRASAELAPQGPTPGTLPYQRSTSSSSSQDSSLADQDDLPMPEPFKIKMVESITRLPRR